MTRDELTPQRLKLLEFVAGREPFPSRREIADHMGWKNESSAGEVIRWLAYHGLVGRSGNRWFVTPKGREAIMTEGAQ